MAKTTATLDTIAVFKGIAASHAAAANGIDCIKGSIAVLRDAGIVMGKSVKTCQYRVQCTDAYVQAFPKTAKKTIANYVTAVVDCVNNGTEFSLSASKGKGKGKGAQKGAEKTGQEKMEHALLNVWKLSDVGEDVLVEIETIMADAIPLIDAIQMVLQKAGFALDGVESAE